jgi:GMP synthase (glutamine-hydrolysing)
MLFVMGGPMGVYDEAACPWLSAEKKAIERMIRAGKMVVGICLGAQLIADVLGARVYTNRYREIGWFPVSFPQSENLPGLLAGLPERADAFHWHQDTFDIPAGATRVAGSEACENQAFCYGNTTLAVQFHWEITAAGVENLIANCPDDYAPGKPWVQQPEEMLADMTRFQRSQGLMGIVLQNAAQLAT